jgi:GMP synthase-like glutamine amidotransferase
VTRALVVLQDALSDAGYVGERLADRGIELVPHVVCAGPEQPHSDVPFPDPRAYDLVVALGAVWSVYDHDTIGSWIDRELAMLRDANEAGVPVLGICFGGQALAAALGGTVARAPAPEIGWYEIDADVPTVANGPWLQWHVDRFTVPPGATELARGGVGPQAFRAGRSLGLQFHPEVTPAIVEFWADHGRDTLERLGIDAARLLADTKLHTPLAREHAHRLVDAFLDDELT